MMGIDFRPAFEPFVNKILVRAIEHGINAHRHLFFAHQCVKCLDHKRSDLGFVDGSEAITDAFASRELHGALRQRKSRRRNVFGDQFLGMIQQDTRGFAGFFVAKNFSVLGILGVFVDSGKLESALVGPGGKSVEADKEYGIVRRGRAQCLI